MRFTRHVVAPLPALLLAVLAGTPAAFAETLFSFRGGQGGEQNGVVSSISYPVEHNGGGHPRLFEDFSFTPNDIGKTVTVTRDTESDFDAFTALLTDGVRQDITFWVFPAPAQNFSGAGFPEAFVVWNDAADPRIDLQGRRIDAYTLRVDTMEITNGATRSTFHTTYTFSGITVPEPGAAAPVAAAVALLLRRRRRVP